MVCGFWNIRLVNPVKIQMYDIILMNIPVSEEKSGTCLYISIWRDRCEKREKNKEKCMESSWRER
jgi:hypothetical protein